MSQVSQDPAQLQGWIDRLQSGEPGARDDLLGHACERLRRLTRKMLRGYARLRRWEETDDVLNSAMLRLWTALQQVTPRTVREFYGLASLQIRRELLDLARHYYGPRGAGANHASGLFEAADGGDSSALDDWREFHERVAQLPDEEREVVGLHYYQGLPHADIAEMLGVDLRTVQRRWQHARLLLHRMVKGPDAAPPS